MILWVVRFRITLLARIGLSNLERNAMNIVKRFHRIYIGDSIISRIEIDMRSARCAFHLNGASLLKEGSGNDIFDPEERYAPACLSFAGVLSISCPEGKFCLNSTIVDFEAVPAENELIEFRLEMTGGYDQSTFTRSLVIEARDFSLAQEQ